MIAVLQFLLPDAIVSSAYDRTKIGLNPAKRRRRLPDGKLASKRAGTL